MKELKKWDKRLKMNKVANMLIIPLFILAISIIALTIYSSNVGNFVIGIREGDEMQLSLSMDPLFGNSRSLLLVQGVDNMRDTTYAIIPRDVIDVDGDNSDKRKNQYLAFSFYLRNEATVDLGYFATIEITGVSRGVDEAIRVMVAVDGERTIYKKYDERSFYEMIGEENNPSFYYYDTQDFVSDTVVMRQNHPLLTSGQVVRYSVLIWLEGWDDDCKDHIKNGDIRMEMRFGVLGQG